MALTNVWRQNNDGEWVRTTAAFADREYAYTVSANAGHFRCYSCFQYVTFVKGNAAKSSYFMHSSGYADKDCEDRSQNISRSSYYFTLSDTPIPMRLIVEGGRACFQIGLLPINTEELDKAFASSLTLTIKGNYGAPRVYRLDRSLVAPHTTAWFEIPEEWVQSYSISFEPSKATPTMWKRAINHIGDDGAMFEVATGRRLPDRSDVQVGKEYYFVKNCNTDFFYSAEVIRLERVGIRSYNVWIYKIRALVYSTRASDFFFDYAKMRLTQKPTEIDILWPPMLEEDGVMTTNLRMLWVLSRGEADLQTYPKSVDFVRSSFTTANGKARIAQLHNVGVLQMICAERYNQ